MKHHSIKRTFSILMVLIITLVTVLQVSASGIDYGMDSTTYARKTMYEYNTSDIEGVMLTNAVYHCNTYAFTIARADIYNGTPSVTEFGLSARIFCIYPSGSNPTSVASDPIDETPRHLDEYGIYLNSGNATYRTPLTTLYSLRAYNIYNNVLFVSEFIAGVDFNFNS